MMALFVVGMVLLLAFISVATYRTGQLLKVWRPEENLLLVPIENLARLGMIGLAVALGLIGGRGPAALGWLPAAPVADTLLGLLIGPLIALVILPPTLWVRRRHPEWYSDVVLQTIRPRRPREWPAVVLALLPVAVLEELIFRSLLLGGFAPYVNVVFFAVAASIFFGLLHRPQGEWGVAVVTVVGLVFSALFLWRHSLLLVVIAHWSANVTQLILAEWFGER